MSPGTYNVTVTDANGCTATGNATITQPAVLVASAVVDTNVSCNGGNNGVATASATGGTLPYSFLWNNGATTATANGLLAGNYTVTITDANGCTDTESITISEPTAVAASISLNNIINCNGGANGALSASATGGTGLYTYAWSNGGTSSLITGLTAGVYTVTVTDANGCTDTSSFNLTEPTLLIASIPSLNDVSCFGGNDGNATADATGGTLPYSFLWSNGNTAALNTSLVAGTYTVTVTDANGCTSAIAAIIQEPDSISNSFTIANVSCNAGSNGFIISTPTGGTPAYSYAWSNAQVGDSIGGLTAGAYTVTITDFNGCTNVFSTSISEPTILVAGIAFEGDVSCAGDSTGFAVANAAGGTAPYTYSWPAGFLAINDSLLDIPAGSYTVTVTDANGCQDTAVATIIENTPIVISVDSLLDVNCEGGSDGYAAVSATGGIGGYTYIWSNGGTAFENDSLMAGISCVTITDALGCSEFACVTLAETNPLPVIDLGNDTSLCDTSFVIDANPGLTYNWSTAETSASITVNTTGLYSVTVTDANGCENTDTISVTLFPIVTFDLDLDSTSCVANTGAANIINLQGGGGFNIDWSTGDTAVLGIDSLALGVYSVTVSDSNGCSLSDTFEIVLSSNISLIAAADSITCNGANDGVAFVSAFNGIAPYSYLWSNGGTNDTIQNLSAGTYIVTVTDGAGCIAIDSALVIEPDPITFAFATLDADCGDSNGYAAVINLLPTGNYSFIWDDPNNQTTDTASQLPAGIYNVTVTNANGCVATQQIIINNIGAPITTMFAQDENCAGSFDGFATVSSSSLSPLTYLWNDPAAQVTDTAFSLSSGTYFVTVTDTAGCQTIDSISIQTLFPQAFVDLGPDTTLCADSIVLSAPAGFASYAWSNGSTGNVASINQTGIVSLIVTDTNGCTATDTINVTLFAPLSYQAVILNAACQEDTGSISLNITSGNGAISFIWSTGDTTSSIDSLSQGFYAVTVTDSAACSVTESFQVIAVDAPILTLSATDASCFGDIGNISFFATGGAAPYTYVWSNGQIGDPNPVTAGVYIVTLTDDSGCVVIDSVEVGQPQAISIDFVIEEPNCADSNGAILAQVTNSQGPVLSYLWNDPQSSTSASIDSLMAGFYSVTVTDSAGCIQVGNISLSDSGAATLNLFASQNLCDNESLAFAAVSAEGFEPFNYLWSDPLAQVTDTAFNLANGIYAVFVTDTNGCVAVADTTITSINNAPMLDLGADRLACDGSEIILTPGGGYNSYLWSTGATTPSIVAFGSQPYSVTVSNAALCFNSDTVLVTFVAPPSINLGPDTIVCVDDLIATVTLNAGEGFLSYQWNTNETTQEIEISETGLYAVTVSNAPTCFGSDQVIVVFDTCVNVSADDLTGLDNTGIQLFPNPNRGEFQVKLSNIELKDATVSVRNATGQLVDDVMLKDGYVGQQEIEFNLSFAPKGIYLVTLTTNGKRIDRRVIIQ
jgi:hypothetical protein